MSAARLAPCSPRTFSILFCTGCPSRCGAMVSDVTFRGECSFYPSRLPGYPSRLAMYADQLTVVCLPCGTTKRMYNVDVGCFFFLCRFPIRYDGPSADVRRIFGGLSFGFSPARDPILAHRISSLHRSRQDVGVRLMIMMRKRCRGVHGRTGEPIGRGYTRPHASLSSLVNYI